MTIPAAASPPDTTYELEIIDEPAATPAPSSPRPQASDSRSEPASPGRPPTNVSPLLMDDLVEPELPLSTLVENVSSAGTARGSRRGGRSKTTIDPDNPPPPIPGQSESAWDKIAARNARARGGDQGPSPWFSLMGVDFTPIKTIVLLALLLLIGGIMGWWFTGPGRGLHLVDAYPVTRLEAMGSLSRIKNPGIMSSKLKGHALPSTGAITNPLGDDFPEELYNVGGADKLIFTRPDARGDYIFVHLKISERVAREEKLESRYDLSFGSGSFIMHVGQQQITPVLMVAPLQTSSMEFPIAASKAVTYESMLPHLLTPEEIRNPQQGNGGLSGGVLVFNGASGVNGSVEYSSPYLQSGYPGVSGLIGHGEITQQDPLTGTALKYAYQGSEMTVSWNTPGKAWWSAESYQRPAGISPFAKFDIYLLYPRPQTNEPMVIKVNERVVATLPASMAATPGQTPSTVKVASIPAATPTAGQATVSTTGTQAMLDDDDDDDEAPKVSQAVATAAPKPAGDPSVFDYFTALARARDMGKGVVAESNMKQLGLGVLTFAQQNNGNLPQTMDDLRSVLGDINALLVNARTGSNPGFMYFPPGRNINSIANPEKTPILYEIKDGKLDRQGSIMYLDGRIEHPKK